MGEPPRVISGVIIHLENQLPILVDLIELPGPQDLVVRCTNVRAVDGKRPQFVHDRNSTFIFPITMIRLIEAPAMSDEAALVADDTPFGLDDPAARPPSDGFDEEAAEDFLARIRQI